MLKALLVLCVIAISGCKYFDPTIPWYDKIRSNSPEGADPAYKQGWDDGCHTGYAVFGNHFYKSFYGYKRDDSMVGNYQYEVAWYNGYNYCRQSVNVMISDGVL